MSSGYDEINNMLLKLRLSLLIPLEIIFNKSLSTCEVPSLMKLAEVIPLHKGEDHTILTKYRPISLLVTLSKVLEKVMSNRIYKHGKKQINFINVNMGLEKNTAVNKL